MFLDDTRPDILQKRRRKSIKQSSVFSDSNLQKLKIPPGSSRNAQQTLSNSSTTTTTTRDSKTFGISFKSSSSKEKEENVNEEEKNVGLVAYQSSSSGEDGVD